MLLSAGFLKELLSDMCRADLMANIEVMKLFCKTFSDSHIHSESSSNYPDQLT